VERPPLTFYIDLGFSSSFRHMATKAQAELPQTLASPFAHLAWGIAYLVHVSNTPPW
jgi:hypothetical protein